MVTCSDSESDEEGSEVAAPGVVARLSTNTAGRESVAEEARGVRAKAWNRFMERGVPARVGAEELALLLRAVLKDGVEVPLSTGEFALMVRICWRRHLPLRRSYRRGCRVWWRVFVGHRLQAAKLALGNVRRVFVGSRCWSRVAAQVLIKPVRWCE
jgi:hypothetical protein